MTTVRKALAFLAFAALAALVMHSGLLQEHQPGTSPTATTPSGALDGDGENGPLPPDPRPPRRALQPSPGLSHRQQSRLKGFRIYLHAPLTLGPIEIRAAGHRTRPALLIIHTGVPASAARTTLKAARYAYGDNSSYDLKLQHQGVQTAPGRGPIATAASHAVRRAVELTPSPGTTTISLPAVTAVTCKPAGRRHTCVVQTLEFLADRTTTTMNTHRRSYQTTVTTTGGKPRVTRITAAS